MKKIFSIMLLALIFLFNGCSTQFERENSADIQANNIQKYSTNFISVEFPNTYKATEKDEMLILRSQNGKIIIGGFTVSAGHPDPEQIDFPFQTISFSKDPKMNADAVPAALYYRKGDKATEKELQQIIKSVTNLP